MAPVWLLAGPFDARLSVSNQSAAPCALICPGYMKNVIARVNQTPSRSIVFDVII